MIGCHCFSTVLLIENEMIQKVNLDETIKQFSTIKVRNVKFKHFIVIM